MTDRDKQLETLRTSAGDNETLKQNVKAARALLDLTDEKLDKEGNIKGL